MPTWKGRRLSTIGEGGWQHRQGQLQLSTVVVVVVVVVAVVVGVDQTVGAGNLNNLNWVRGSGQRAALQLAASSVPSAFAIFPLSVSSLSFPLTRSEYCLSQCSPPSVVDRRLIAESSAAQMVTA